MPINTERTVAFASVNNSYGVEVWQERKSVDYTSDDARKLAREILDAADEADMLEEEDRAAAFGGDVCQPFTTAEALKVSAFGFDRHPMFDGRIDLSEATRLRNVMEAN